MSVKKPWSPGRVIFWLIVGGLLGLTGTGMIGNEPAMAFFGCITGLGLLLGAIRLMIK